MNGSGARGDDAGSGNVATEGAAKRRWLRLAMVIGVGGAVAGLVWLGAFEPLRDPEQVEDWLRESGIWGQVLYVLGFLALQPLSLPGAVLVIPATFVWPSWQVFLLSWLGGILASTVAFSIARWLGRDWVDARLPDRFRRWDDRLAEHGLLAPIGLRLVPGYAPPADWALGVSSVTVPQFLLGTAIGLIPITAGMSWFGDDAVRAAQRAPLLLVPIAGLVAAGVALSRYRRRRSADFVVDDSGS